MAREDFSERGLPSQADRRQIMRRAGAILAEARELRCWLERYEKDRSPLILKPDSRNKVCLQLPLRRDRIAAEARAGQMGRSGS